MEEIKIYVHKEYLVQQKASEDIIKRILEISDRHSYYTISHSPFDQNASYSYVICPSLIDKEKGLAKIVEELNNIKGIQMTILSPIEKDKK